jgi:uncharacterized membrane protein YccC
VRAFTLLDDAPEWMRRAADAEQKRVQRITFRLEQQQERFERRRVRLDKILARRAERDQQRQTRAQEKAARGGGR